jgi:hypothetical protein
VGPASFYDFVAWWLAREGGVLIYDHAAGTYTLTGEKPEGEEAATLLRDEVASLTHVFDAVPRSAVRVVNVDADLGARHRIEAAEAAPGVYRDLVVRAATQQSVDDRVALETARPRVPRRTVNVRFGRHPVAAIAPGRLLEISSRGGFSPDLLPAEEPWRVYALRLMARSTASGPDHRYQDPAAEFDYTLEAQLESQGDPTPRLPAFHAPRYPGYVEGRVLSGEEENEEGEQDDEITYEIVQDEETSLEHYRVRLPLFEDQEVHPPFVPEHGSGMFYVPAYKNARVLVALSLDRAQLASVLDWRPGARVPVEGQGQHVLLGKSAESNTSVLHTYEEEQPVFRILRTHAGDTALVRLEEGRMVLQVQESEDGGGGG